VWVVLNEVSFDPGENWREVGGGTYDAAGENDLTAALAFVLADVQGVEATALEGPLLYDCVDVGAVETAIFGCDPADRGLEAVAFRYDSYLVNVRRDGQIRVFEAVD
jgi:hypothetical protein